MALLSLSPDDMLLFCIRVKVTGAHRHSPFERVGRRNRLLFRENNRDLGAEKDMLGTMERAQAECRRLTSERSDKGHAITSLQDIRAGQLLCFSTLCPIRPSRNAVAPLQLPNGDFQDMD